MQFDQPPQAKDKAGKSGNSSVEQARREKELKFQAMRKDIDDWGDGLGLGVDEGIKDAVTTFNVMGLTTSASCEGHDGTTKNGFPAPWVDFQVPNEPEWRYKNEEKIYKKIAKKYGISVEDVLRSVNDKAWVEAVRLSAKQEETEEFKRWSAENEKLFIKIEGLLDEFYASRDVSEEIHIVVERGATYTQIHNGGKFFIPNTNEKRLIKELTVEERRDIPKVLYDCQAEMNLFTEFLKKKYFEDDQKTEQIKIELIENSTVEIDNKMELMLLLFEQKQGVQLGDYKIAENYGGVEKVMTELSLELSNILRLLSELKLSYQIVKELSDDEGIVGFSVLVSKDKDILGKFIKADKEKDDKTFGLILGYPPTAVEAYNTDQAFHIREELSPEELEKLRSEGILPFLMFSASRGHWIEELEWARQNQELVKKKSPKLYQELLVADL